MNYDVAEEPIGVDVGCNIRNLEDPKCDDKDGGDPLVNAEFDDSVTSLKLSLKSGTEFEVDLSALATDVRLEGGAYNKTTKKLELSMSDGGKVEIPVADLLPVETGDGLNGIGTSSDPIVVKVQAGDSNLLKIVNGELVVEKPLIATNGQGHVVAEMLDQKIYETITSIDYKNNKLTYVDEEGNTKELDLSDLKVKISQEDDNQIEDNVDGLFVGQNNIYTRDGEFTGDRNVKFNDKKLVYDDGANGYITLYAKSYNGIKYPVIELKSGSGYGGAVELGINKKVTVSIYASSSGLSVWSYVKNKDVFSYSAKVGKFLFSEDVKFALGIRDYADSKGEDGQALCSRSGKNIEWRNVTSEIVAENMPTEATIVLPEWTKYVTISFRDRRKAGATKRYTIVATVNELWEMFDQERVAFKGLNNNNNITTYEFKCVYDKNTRTLTVKDNYQNSPNTYGAVTVVAHP